MVLKAIGFDFDGTLVMSEAAKARVMALVFREKFGVRQGVMAAYREIAGTGKNRPEKVQALFQQFLKRKPTKKELQEVDEHFGFHYELSMHTCPLFRCSSALEGLKKRYFTFLLSLENKREVVRIARHCGLATYFHEILGGSKAKVENLRHVITKHHLKSKEVLYVGDSSSDVLAAKKVGVKVIILQKDGRSARTLKKLGAERVIRSLCEMREQGI